MRNLLLLLVVVLAFLAVRAFRPAAASGPTTATESAAPQDSGQGEARFLPPPSPAAKPAQALKDPPPSPAPSAPPATTPQPAEPVWPQNLLPSEAGPAEEVALAASLLHGTPAEVQSAAQGLPKDRALLLEAFAWSVAGERQLALSLSNQIAKKEGLDGRERALFEAALLGQAATPASTSRSPVTLAMEMRLLAREGEEALAARQYPEAAQAFSSLLVGELEAPWQADSRVLGRWTESLDTAQREYRWNPRADWPAAEVTVQPGDSLIAIRMRYLADRPGALMCTGLIERANRLKGHLQPGQLLRIPTDPVRIQVDLEARWALYFLGNEVAAAWPVGIGRPGEDTPPGDYKVRNKLENPPWMKEGQEPVAFGDPKNPLGTRWMGWSTQDGAKTSYGFHGTWEPASIGKAASDGCIRFLNEDVEELFQILPEGAPIRIAGGA